MRHRIAEIIALPSKETAKSVLLASMCTLIVGCSSPKSKPRAPENAEIRQDLINLTESHHEVSQILEREAEPISQPFEVVAYVDQSESIRGFVPVAGDTFYEGSDFEELLRALAHQSELKSFVGFGTGEPGQPAGEQKEIRRDFARVPPLSKDGYNILNNNFSVLIDELTAEFNTDRISIMITDGVQSHADSGRGSAMGATAAAAQRWLAKGGTVDARILTAPMKGKYFSEELRAAGKPYSFSVAEKDRPFLVLSFIPTPDLLDDWNRLMARERIALLDWKATYQLPQFQTAAAPVATVVSQLFDPEKSQRLGMMEMDNKPVDGTRQLPQLDENLRWKENVFAAAVSEKLLMDSRGNALSEIPLTFEIGGVTEGPIAAESWLRSFRQLRPSINVYSCQDPESNEWADATQGSIDLSIKDPAIPVEMIPGVEGQESMMKAKVTYQLPWLAGSPCIAVLSMQRATEKVDPPSFSLWSTINDSTPEEMKKVYNLQTLLEQIAGDSVKLTKPSGTVIYLYPN
jgi:hypothetical protein